MTNENPLLGPNQRRLVGYTFTFACFVSVIGLFVFSIQVLGLLVSTFSSLLWPLAVAGILALMLRPIVFQFQTRLNISPVFAVILLYTLVVIASVGVLEWFFPVLVAQISDIAVLVLQLVCYCLHYLLEKLSILSDKILIHILSHI